MERTDTEMDMKLEVVPIPVSDVDAAKAFYTEKIGFHLDHDTRPNERMRVLRGPRRQRMGSTGDEALMSLAR
jgi:catechol 2,3-dioxygenase-like lactoylglutathione lyase family enzyme